MTLRDRAVDSPRHPYEAIANRPPGSLVARADTVLRDGWTKRDQPVIHLAGPIPWDESKPSLRSWVFALHCLDMIEMPLCAHDVTGEDRYLESPLRVALDWISSCADDKAGARYPFAWYDMAAGMRVHRLAYLWEAGAAAGLLTEAGGTALFGAVEDHLRWLADDANVAFHSNHGYYQVAGQLAAARRLAPRSLVARRAEAQARRRLARLVEAQFAEDGCHLEHSPDYHRMVLDTLRGLIRADLDPDGTLSAVARRAEEALSWFVAPNGRLVNFGDSDDRDMRLRAADAEQRWSMPAMRHAASAGDTGRAPEASQRAFASGGYFAARSEDGAGYLALTACFHSRTHKQADDLSFVWHERAQPILIDAGRYGYIDRLAKDDPLRAQGFWYGDDNRRYCESTRAHNTVAFDGRDAARVGVKPYGSALKRWEQTADGVHVVEAVVRQHGAIMHERRLAWRPGRWLQVVDGWSHEAGSVTAPVQWFHLAPDLEAAITEDGLIAESGEGVCVDVSSDARIQPPIRGRTVPELQGWWSPSERRMEEATAFSIVAEPSTRGEIVTLFVLNADDRSDAQIDARRFTAVGE